MIFTFLKPANPNDFGLPKEIKKWKDDWFIFCAEVSYRLFFPRDKFTSLGRGWWYVNDTGDYLYTGRDKVFLYSVQKDTELVIEPIYKFREDNNNSYTE